MPGSSPGMTAHEWPHPSHEMAAHTLASHHGGVAVGEPHRARGGILPRRGAGFAPEPGLTVKLVSPAEIVRLIKRGVFVSQLHIGALLLAELNGFLALPRTAPRGRRNSRGMRKRRRT